MITLVLKSLASRGVVTTLLILTIAIGSALICAVETIHDSARSSFTNTISGTDLIVGGRNSDLSILLNSIFLKGDSLYAVPSTIVKEITDIEEVAWTVPISLGDYFNGFPVIGTTNGFLKHYRFGKNRSLLPIANEVSRDQLLKKSFTAVIGAEVAESSNLNIGSKIIFSHGEKVVSDSHVHDESPIIVEAILGASGTPMDRAVFVNLQSIGDIHSHFDHGPPKTAEQLFAEFLSNSNKNEREEEDTHLDAYSAILVGLHTPQSVFTVKNQLENNLSHALTAVMPGITLVEFWEIVAGFEFALKWISIAVIICALAGMLAVAMASVAQRRQEIALYRAIGANKSYIYRLMSVEAFVVGLIGTILGVAISLVAMKVIEPTITLLAGIRIENYKVWFIAASWLLVLIPISCIVANLIPISISYRSQFIKGLNNQ